VSLPHLYGTPPPIYTKVGKPHPNLRYPFNFSTPFLAGRLFRISERGVRSGLVPILLEAAPAERVEDFARSDLHRYRLPRLELGLCLVYQRLSSAGPNVIKSSTSVIFECF
jgi:hypothetical protein